MTIARGGYDAMFEKNGYNSCDLVTMEKIDNKYVCVCIYIKDIYI